MLGESDQFVIDLKDIRKSFGAVARARRVSLRLLPGQSTASSGKTAPARAR
jgi:ABC-type sugar transport system ATPase subunit